ncbi:calcium-dependent phosphoinositide phospholipase C [Tenacibaculum adriaticum]|uniref:Calcium-dependent phosphoinositide phospholipase C n=1 Tax=Tenacibaculum adriaticum TaxID=413713 RepID=A0A5S5DSD2_9FLAO|nr:Ca2+-dependent phosphoinositide-specific phospholipase C [Tenacibaculum adriaticum]TYP98797.1 calcium-dependent phosphoinositide phospholipase C [Tenacibaculum adriaticum]
MKFLKPFFFLLLISLFIQCEKNSDENDLNTDNIELESLDNLDNITANKGTGISVSDLNNLKYHQIVFKGSHNSYERNESIGEQLTRYVKSDGKTSENGNCMGVELDIWRHTSSFTPNGDISDNFWTVNHTSGLFGDKLSKYLNELKQWHDGSPDHYPIMVKLDIKSTGGGFQNFHDQIDTYLKRYLGENLIFKPNTLFTNPNVDLATNVSQYGWPSINEMRGKYIFVLTGNESWGETYAGINLRDSRLCFTMKEMPADREDVYPPNGGNKVFFNFHIYNSNKDKWTKSIPRFASKNYISRVYIANSQDNFDNSIGAKVSCISTDKVNNHGWAIVTDNHKFDKK